jgi:hypothetical protein
VTVSDSEDATVLDSSDGLITRFLVIQDLSAVVEAYRSNSTEADDSTAREASIPGMSAASRSAAGPRPFKASHR